ncbi:MAG: hypothetical protein ACLR0P_05770 [Oscillospiraceae bacterium]
MNKRFLAKILTLCMIVSMVQLPVSAASADTDTAPATGTGISWTRNHDGTYKVNDDVTVSGTYTVGNDANGTYVIALDTDTGNTETYSLTMDTIVVASDSKLTVSGGAVKAIYHRRRRYLQGQRPAGARRHQGGGTCGLHRS